MSYYVIVFLVLVGIFVISYLKKKNKKTKRNIQQNTTENYTREKSSNELFNKYFGNLDNVKGAPKRVKTENSTSKLDIKENNQKTSQSSNQNKPHEAKNTTEKKELTFAEKKAKGIYSTRGAVRVSGGLLPHHSSMGMIDFYYDGKKAPSLTGSRGKISIYKTDGNLQVFYKNPNDIKDKEFLGLIVDMYKI